MKLEALMVRAIREFSKHNPGAEIRSCYIAEGSGGWKNWNSATFRIEYVFESGGEYRETYVQVDI